MPEPSTRVEPASAGAPVPYRLPFLDGLRGLAALYVVNHHILQAVGWRPEQSKLPYLVKQVINLFAMGHAAVGVFIVLSGYCLMLPVLKAGTNELTGGAVGYIRRRAKRILPPYYAALAATLLLLTVLPQAHPQGTENLSVGQIVSHALLLHNLSPETVWGINGPMWSVASEWQIYFLFPLVLLPVWRKWGAAAAVGVGFALGSLAAGVGQSQIWKACPWYLGLFATGMAGAVITHGGARSMTMQARVAAFPWGRCALVFWVAAWAISNFKPEWCWYNHGGKPRVGTIVVDALTGFGTVCLIARMAFTSGATGSARRPGSAMLLKAMTGRAAMALGAISYSLYLTHMPLVALVSGVIKRKNLSFRDEYAMVAAVAIPLALVLAAVWWRMFEKPFLAGRHLAEAKPAKAATPVAAPAMAEPVEEFAEPEFDPLLISMADRPGYALVGRLAKAA